MSDSPFAQVHAVTGLIAATQRELRGTPNAAERDALLREIAAHRAHLRELIGPTNTAALLRSLNQGAHQRLVLAAFACAAQRFAAGCFAWVSAQSATEKERAAAMRATIEAGTDLALADGELARLTSASAVARRCSVWTNVSSVARLARDASA